MGALAVERLVDHAERHMTDAMFVGDSKPETDFVRCVWWGTGASHRERAQLRLYFELRRHHRTFKPGTTKPTPRPDLVAAWVELVEAVGDGRVVLGRCICGKPLEGRQRTCSAACRQRRSRSRRKSTTPVSRGRRHTKTAGQRG